MKQSDKLKELLEEIHILAEESILYLPIMESLDHEEKEPLIKDEKICKAVRVWAESCGGINKPVLCHNSIGCVQFEYSVASMLHPDAKYIMRIKGKLPREFNLPKNCSIAELCGEEE